MQHGEEPRKEGARALAKPSALALVVWAAPPSSFFLASPALLVAYVHEGFHDGQAPAPLPLPAPER